MVLVVVVVAMVLPALVAWVAQALLVVLGLPEAHIQRSTQEAQ
jgi:hypothetical protein